MGLFHKQKLRDYLKPDKNGLTPLHAAAVQGFSQVMEDLRASGEKLTLADLLIKSESGDTPFYLAVTHGHLHLVVKILLASGEKLTVDHVLEKNIKKVGAWTPLHSAAQNGHLDRLMEALQVFGERLLPEHFLIKGNGLTPSRLFGGFQQGIESPLDWAVKNGHLDQVFNPSHWAKRVGEMIKLWEHVPKSHKKDIDFNVLRDQAMQDSIRVHKIEPETFREAMRAADSFSAEDLLVDKERSN